jgi:hypothetical protein
VLYYVPLFHSFRRENLKLKENIYNAQGRCGYAYRNPSKTGVRRASQEQSEKNHWCRGPGASVFRKGGLSKQEWMVREGVGAGGRNDPSLVCTYE